MCSFNAAQLLVSISVHATRAILICVLLDVFDITRHNKSAVVHCVAFCHLLSVIGSVNPFTADPVKTLHLAIKF